MKFDIEIHEYCLMILSDDLNPATIPLSQILRVEKKWESVLSAPLILYFPCLEGGETIQFCHYILHVFLKDVLDILVKHGRSSSKVVDLDRPKIEWNELFPI